MSLVDGLTSTSITLLHSKYQDIGAMHTELHVVAEIMSWGDGNDDATCTIM
jgi:hypothetical protein